MDIKPSNSIAPKVTAMDIEANSKLSDSMAPKVTAMDVEAKPYASNQSDQNGHEDRIYLGSEWGTPAVEEGEAEAAGCWPDWWPEWLVDCLLPEVPPGNLDEKECGISKRCAELIVYFGLLIFTMVSGWLAFIEYRNTRRDARRNSSSNSTGQKLEYIWLASLVLLAVYNVIGPLPRPLCDLLGAKPGGYYFYTLRENDCLNPNFARTSMLILTTLATVLQFSVFHISFRAEVAEKGVKVPAAIAAIVPALLDLGSVLGINDLPGMKKDTGKAGDMRSLVRKALYSDPIEGGSQRQSARQKLVGRILLAKVLLWVSWGVFLTIAYIAGNKYGVQW